jgi:hypothetical protein
VRSDPWRAHVLYVYQDNVSQTGRDAGNILRSDDGGRSWRSIFHVEIRVCCPRLPQLKIDPTNGDRLWLSGLAEGLFTSDDGGATWQAINLESAALGPSSVGTDVAFSPAEPEVVYVSHKGRLLKGDFRQRQTRAAIEYYAPSADLYWVTANAGEAQAMDFGAEPGVSRTGKRFDVWNAASGSSAGALDVCRFQGNPAYGQHARFLTVAGGECEALKRTPVWNLETETDFHAFAPLTPGACGPGQQPVLRFYNGRFDANHRYVTDAATAQEMRARGWIDEGVVMCASPAAQ